MMKKARVSKSAATPAKKAVEEEEAAPVVALAKSASKKQIAIPKSASKKQKDEAPVAPKSASKKQKDEAPVAPKSASKKKEDATPAPKSASKKKEEEAPAVVAAPKSASKKRTADAVAKKPEENRFVTSAKPTEAIISKAVEALLHHVKEHRKASEASAASKSKKPLPGVSKEDSAVFLQVGFRRTPEAAIKTFKGHAIALPHNFRAESVRENVCLLVKDKSEARKQLGEDYSNKFGVKKLIDLQQLRTRYKSFQQKRDLANEYDCFLCDDRIACMLPKALGKAFYVGSGKRPLPIRFGVKNIKESLKQKVDKALGATYIYLSGVSTVVKVGDVSMEEQKLRENIAACINGAVEHVPGKWDGIQALFIKSEKSASLPIYEVIA